ncbi:HD domain-containing protein [Marinomonas sp.]
MTENQLASYERLFQPFLCDSQGGDVAHDVAHLTRVVKTAKQLALEEKAELAIVVPAAWLHDCVSYPKNHPERHLASLRAADKAVEFLASIGYPSKYFADIHHAIHAHSFSANQLASSLAAKIVQDADRLDALGAIGIARCMQVSGALNRPLYAPEDPFCETRALDDQHYSIDHFYKKLFHISDQLNTASARMEGKRREQVMRGFLTQLAAEI